MPDFLSDGLAKLNDLVEGGDDVHDAVAKVVQQMQPVLMLEAEQRLLAMHRRKKKQEWAEPGDIPSQLRFNYQGEDLAIPDTPVRKVDENNQEYFVPARFTTAEERLESTHARIQHHQSHIRRAESEIKREETQAAVASDLGIDLYRTPWEQAMHEAKQTKCWRCGLGWRSGDPFELGHSDKPESQGGVYVEWEHRSCNRSAKDNPVARPEAAV